MKNAGKFRKNEGKVRKNERKMKEFLKTTKPPAQETTLSNLERIFSHREWLEMNLGGFFNVEFFITSNEVIWEFDPKSCLDQRRELS